MGRKSRVLAAISSISAESGRRLPRRLEHSPAAHRPRTQTDKMAGSSRTNRPVRPVRRKKLWYLQSQESLCTAVWKTCHQLEQTIPNRPHPAFHPHPAVIDSTLIHNRLTPPNQPSPAQAPGYPQPAQPLILFPIYPSSSSSKSRGLGKARTRAGDRGPSAPRTQMD